MMKTKEICQLCRRYAVSLKTKVFTGTEGSLSLLEWLIGRKYYFVLYRLKNNEIYLCSTIFADKAKARSKAELEGGRVISYRCRKAYARYITEEDRRLGNYRKSVDEQIKAIKKGRQ